MKIGESSESFLPKRNFINEGDDVTMLGLGAFIAKPPITCEIMHVAKISQPGKFPGRKTTPLAHYNTCKTKNQKIV